MIKLGIKSLFLFHRLCILFLLIFIHSIFTSFIRINEIIFLGDNFFRLKLLNHLYICVEILVSSLSFKLFDVIF